MTYYCCQTFAKQYLMNNHQLLTPISVTPCTLEGYVPSLDERGGSMLIIILWDNDVKEQLTHQTDELCGRNLFKVCIYCIHFVVGGLNLCFRAKLFNILKQYYLSVPVINNKLLGSRIDCKIDWIVELLDWCCCRHLSIWLLWSCCVLSVVVRRRRRRNTSWWI